MYACHLVIYKISDAHFWVVSLCHSGWKRRYCSLDKTGFKYYKSDNNSEVLGEFPVEEMLSVNICEDESAKDPQ